MAKKKALIDAAIARADDEKGLLLVLTGNGKGKSSSAFGMVARALGHGMKVGVAQFIKARTDTGEEAFFSRQPGVEWRVLGDGFTWDTQNLDQDIASARRGWEVARRMLADPGARSGGAGRTHLPAQLRLARLHRRPRRHRRPATDATCRRHRPGGPAALLEAADTVSELVDVKHAWRAGVKAQKASTCESAPDFRMLTLILGGARSGKSRHAQFLAEQSGLAVTVIATGQPRDAEMAARIGRHQAERPVHWQTVEQPLHLAAGVESAAAPGRCILVDCLTLWLLNLLEAGEAVFAGNALRCWCCCRACPASSCWSPTKSASA